jgi:hypothetical protein
MTWNWLGAALVAAVALATACGGKQVECLSSQDCGSGSGAPYCSWQATDNCSPGVFAVTASKCHPYQPFSELQGCFPKGTITCPASCTATVCGCGCPACPAADGGG